MRIYYRGPDALVTDSQFIWGAQAAKHFAVAELRKVEIVQRTTGSRLGRAAFAGLAATALVLVPGWVILDSTVAHLALAATAAALVTLTALLRRPTRHWELRAEYRHREVLLYSCTNPTTFNQVIRALRRSVESSGPARPRRRMVAV
jgi:Family of unknown function (DUF6232)